MNDIALRRSIAQDLIATEARYGAKNYKPLDVVLTRGEGVFVWDVDGNRYLDCLSAYSAVNQGHCHPKILAAMTEQAGRQTVDARADLFSLGCVLYYLATGALPFEGDDALSTLLAVTTAEPADPLARNPALPAELSRLILRLLAKKPEDRPGSAREVLAALRRIEEEAPDKKIV